MLEFLKDMTAGVVLVGGGISIIVGIGWLLVSFTPHSALVLLGLFIVWFTYMVGGIWRKG